MVNGRKILVKNERKNSTLNTQRLASALKIADMPQSRLSGKVRDFSHQERILN